MKFRWRSLKIMENWYNFKIRIMQSHRFFLLIHLIINDTFERNMCSILTRGYAKGIETSYTGHSCHWIIRWFGTYVIVVYAQAYILKYIWSRNWWVAHLGFDFSFCNYMFLFIFFALLVRFFCLFVVCLFVCFFFFFAVFIFILSLKTKMK